jgi:hypothetical protein
MEASFDVNFLGVLTSERISLVHKMLDGAMESSENDFVLCFV